jgi:CheY-like chemotaxis protein
MSHESPRPHERRRHPRTEVVATVVVFSSDHLHGTYLVQDLSAGGARIVGHIDARPGDSVTALLQMPGKTGFSIAARIVRHERREDQSYTALSFVDLSAEDEDSIHEAILASLARSVATVLVVDRDGSSRDALERDLRSLGHEAVGVATPLEAIAWLDRPDGRISTVVVDVSEGPTQGLDVLDFVGEHHPRIRRLVVAEGYRSDLALHSGRAHGVLRKPWDRLSLAETLARRGDD